jgi:hypothetical protein
VVKEEAKLLYPGLAGFYETMLPIAATIVRVVVGIMFFDARLREVSRRACGGACAGPGRLGQIYRRASHTPPATIASFASGRHCATTVDVCSW